MLVIVVVLFGVCWLPLQIYNFLQDMFPEINEYKYINVFWFGFDWLAMSNSCYNPFIYNYYNEKFRREFRFRLHSCGYRWNSSLRRHQSDTDTFTLSTRMSRYYDTPYRYTCGQKRHIVMTNSVNISRTDILDGRKEELETMRSQAF